MTTVRETIGSLFKAHFFVASQRLNLVPIGTSRLPTKGLTRVGDDLTAVFSELTGTTIRPMSTMFTDQPGWRAFASEQIGDSGKRYWVVIAPSRHDTLDVRERLLTEARDARSRIEDLAALR